MPFTTIFSETCLSIGYDAQRDCLFLHLHDQLEAAALQAIVPKVASLPLSCPAWCLVQDNLSPTHMGAEAVEVLVTYLLPALHQAGVVHWAWACNSVLCSHFLTEQMTKRLPQAALNVFYDLEHAVTWLQQAHPKPWKLAQLN